MKLFPLAGKPTRAKMYLLEVDLGMAALLLVRIRIGTGTDASITYVLT